MVGSCQYGSHFLATGEARPDKYGSNNDISAALLPWVSSVLQANNLRTLRILRQEFGGEGRLPAGSLLA